MARPRILLPARRTIGPPLILLQKHWVIWKTMLKQFSRRHTDRARQRTDLLRRKSIKTDFFTR
jgi:hypothetical protein